MKKIPFALLALGSAIIFSAGLTSCGDASSSQADGVTLSGFSDLANSKNYTAVKGYASSNLRQGKTSPVSVGNLTDGDTSVQSYIIANTTDASNPDTHPWFAVDLGEVKSFNKVKVTPGAGQDADGSYPDAYPVKYKIQMSKTTSAAAKPDDVATFDWITIAEVKDGTLSAKSTSFERKASRWVRILVDEYNGDYCALLELSVFAPDATKSLDSLGKEINVLFVGNSLTYYNNMWNLFEGISLFKGKNVHATAVTYGGKSLEYHSTSHNAETAIKAGNFDFVVLQDICGSFENAKLERGSAAIIPIVKEANPDAKLVYYATWPKNSVKETRTAEFTICYLNKAQKYEALIAPAGEAFYDLSKTNEKSYYDDDTHPQPVGSFLSACTMFYTMFPQEAQITFSDKDVIKMSALINSFVSNSSKGKSESYDKALLNQISELSYKYAHAIAPAAADKTGATKYTSVAGEYEYVETSGDE